MPIATPAAPHAIAATRPRPSVKPPAAMTGMSTASTTCGSSSDVGTVPVWPPPSAPCAMTASTPHSATFSACRRAPIVGIVTKPASLSRAIVSCDGAWAKLATRTPSRMSSAMRSLMSGWSARRFTPKGFGVRCLTSRIAVCSCGYVIVADAMIPKPPAALVAAVNRAPATHPMPVWMIGYSTPKSSHARVCSAPSVMHAPLSRVHRRDRSPRATIAVRRRSARVCPGHRRAPPSRSRSPRPLRQG